MMAVGTCLKWWWWAVGMGLRAVGTVKPRLVFWGLMWYFGEMRKVYMAV